MPFQCLDQGFPLPVLGDWVQGSFFNFQARGGNPSLTLIRVLPSGNSACEVCQAAVDALNNVRGSESITQQLSNPQFVEGKCFLKPFF